MKAAFKEWLVVVDALGCGEQIIILRKGGISEGRGGFKMEQGEFLLFPTLFHQQRESVIPSAQARFDLLWSSLPPDGEIVIDYFARVIGWEKIESFDAAARLEGEHVWRNEVIQERFNWGREESIYAIVVRVFRLKERYVGPNRPEYGGCKSWITLAQDIDLDGATAVLSDVEFAGKLARIQQKLHSRTQATPRLILASTSPRRKELLSTLGLEFETVASPAEELHDPTISVSQLCQQNALRKAEVVAERFPRAIVIGADTLVAMDGHLFGKPASVAEAEEMLQALQGRTHQVVTGVCLLHKAGGVKETFSAQTEVTFRPLTTAQVRAYLEAVHVLDKAGAYGIQERGEMIVEKICGSYSNVVGLPVEEVAERLSRHGFKISHRQ